MDAFLAPVATWVGLALVLLALSLAALREVLRELPEPGWSRGYLSQATVLLWPLLVLVAAATVVRLVRFS